MMWPINKISLTLMHVIIEGVKFSLYPLQAYTLTTDPDSNGR